MDELEPKARRGTPGWVAPAQTSPSHVSFHPERFEPFPELVPWAEEGRKISVHPLNFGDPAGTLESFTGRTSVFFPFLDAA